jgi:hypothetical protein
MGTDLVVIEAAHSASVELIQYDQMCHAIAEVHAIDELRNIKDRFVALQAYAHEARNFELERMAAEIRIRAETRAGELLIEMKKAGILEPARAQKGVKIGTPSLRIKRIDIGITRTESTKWQRLAKIPKPKLEALLADKTTVPSAARIIRATEEPKHKTSVSSEAVGLWSMLRDFENDGLLDKEPAEILAAMTPPMVTQVRALAPRVARWLRLIGKISPAT